MPFSNYALDKFVARDISKFTKHGLAPIAGKYDQHCRWLSNCILNSVFGSPISDEAKPFVFSVLRRAEQSVSEYEVARLYLDEFICNGRHISPYFRAMSHLEVCLYSVYQCHEFTRKETKKDFFTTGDGSVLEKLNRIYSISKHLQKSTMQPNQLHLFWFTDIGLSSSEAAVSYEDIVDAVSDVCEFADQFSKLRYGLSNDSSKD